MSPPEKSQASRIIKLTMLTKASGRQEKGCWRLVSDMGAVDMLEMIVGLQQKTAKNPYFAKIKISYKPVT
jgi:hypothetical protein